MGRGITRAPQVHTTIFLFKLQQHTNALTEEFLAFFVLKGIGILEVFLKLFKNPPRIFRKFGYKHF